MGLNDIFKKGEELLGADKVQELETDLTERLGPAGGIVSGFLPHGDAAASKDSEPSGHSAGADDSDDSDKDDSDKDDSDSDDKSAGADDSDDNDDSDNDDSSDDSDSDKDDSSDDDDDDSK